MCARCVLTVLELSASSLPTRSADKPSAVSLRISCWRSVSATAAPVKLTAGNYWIGIISGVTKRVAAESYEPVKNAEDYNTNTYTSGPSNPFGSFKTTNELMSLYLTYTYKPS
jgi:hypothetical protein